MHLQSVDVGAPDRAERTALPRCCKRRQPIEVVRRRVNWAAQPVRGSGVYLLNKLLRSTLWRTISDSVKGDGRRRADFRVYGYESA
jgi:hypothetical protein